MDLKALIACFNSKYGFHFIACLLSIAFYSAHCEADTTLRYNLAFHYGPNPPINELKFYPNIVLDPGSGVDPLKVASANRKVFAYASLGEAIGLNQYAKPIDKTWVIGKNDKWQSLVMDESNPAWQAFFLDNVITPLWNKGYRGFFLDTLDSYRLAVKTPEQMKKQQEGLIAIIRAIKTKYPDAKIITNRGFELLPQIKSLVDSVVVESLFNSWDNANKKYVDVSEIDRNNLLKELDKVKQMGLPITIVDYVAPQDMEKAKEVAKKISALGFNPWVTNGNMTALYLFDVNTLPRKILLLYQGKLNDVDERIGSYLSRAVAMPLNHMGYVTVLHNINETLPATISAKEYAGIVVASDGILLGREQELYNWYLVQIQKNIPLVILNNFGFHLDDLKLKPFSMSMPLFSYASRSLKVVKQAPMIGYEIPPVLKLADFVPVNLLQGTSLLKVVNEVGTSSNVAAIMPWGGYYLTLNFLVPVVGNNEHLGNNFRWSIDPFQFFKQALRLPDMPVPDTTTENGRRLMFVHLDGDGFANRGQWANAPFVGEVMRQEFFEHYAIPTTASIIQGEIAPNGINPQLSSRLEKIARQIFALPYIEIASHTFSHPFNWQDAADYKGDKANPYTIQVPNYRFNLETEVTGSVAYINNTLAPPGKKCKVILWSGEGDVPKRALELAYQAGLANLNPGTLVTKYNNSLTGISPLGLNEGEFFQVFAPIGNDNETLDYSNSYLYSLIDIIDALKLTDKPRRLKPIDIYIHFYTVQQPGGIKALHEVYDWALAQPVMNIFASDYYNKVMDFNTLLIAKKDNEWIIQTHDDLRELRMPISLGYPDLERSTNVIGYTTYNDDRYIHLGPGGEAFLRTTPTAATLPFLQEANTRITRFIRNNKGIDFSVEGYLPPKFTFANMDFCSLWNKKEKIAPQSQDGHQKSYAFEKGVKYDLSIQCE